MRKPDFSICGNKDTDQLRSNTAQLISAFVFAIWIVQSLYFLNPEFQDSSHLLWLYSPVCVGLGRKSRRPVFSQRGSFHLAVLSVPGVRTVINYNYRRRKNLSWIPLLTSYMTILMKVYTNNRSMSNPTIWLCIQQRT